MKKLLFFILCFSILQLSAQKIDSLIGKWQLIKEIENNVDSSSKCTRKTTLEFLSNGTCSIIEFVEESEFDDTCSSETRKSTWKNLNNSEYLFGNKNNIQLTFEKDTYYYISKTEGYTMKYVYKKLIN
jgi:hypothetical protein